MAIQGRVNTTTIQTNITIIIVGNSSGNWQKTTAQKAITPLKQSTSGKKEHTTKFLREIPPHRTLSLFLVLLFYFISFLYVCKSSEGVPLCCCSFIRSFSCSFNNVYFNMNYMYAPKQKIQTILKIHTRNLNVLVIVLKP